MDKKIKRTTTNKCALENLLRGSRRKL